MATIWSLTRQTKKKTKKNKNETKQKETQKNTLVFVYFS